MLDAEHRHATNVPARRAARRPPILVTGAPRSGSTWVGNILALDADSGYVHEPFNKNCPNGRCRASFRQSFTYVTAETEGPYLEALRDTIAWKYSLGADLAGIRTPRNLARMLRDFGYFEAMRRRSARMILKDPLALFSAEWIAARFGAQVVVVIRHPAAFVASLRAAGWHRVHFELFRDQPLLMRDRLAPFADEIAAASRVMPDAVDAGVLLWRILHHHIDLLRTAHPDWIFVRHEDLSRDPAAGFGDLFDQLGLGFSPAVRGRLAQFSNPGAALSRLSLYGTRRRTMRNSFDAVAQFRTRLTAPEIDRIRATAAPQSALFYTDADW